MVNKLRELPSKLREIDSVEVILTIAVILSATALAFIVAKTGYR